jgi:pilus assembly protein CpaB
VVLAVALLLGLAAAFLVKGYLDARTRPAAVATEPEVVAAQDIPSGTLLTAAMLLVRQVPPAYVVPGTARAPGALLGGIVREDIVAGEPVLPADVASGDAGSGLAFAIPQGDVALTVSVDPLAGQDGMLRPGDRVDVVGIVTSGAGIPAPAVSTPLRGIPVLAVGQTTDPGSAAQGGYTTVTLAVNTQEAEEIVYLEHFQSLTLTLEPPSQPSSPVAPFTAGSLAGVAA